MVDIKKHPCPAGIDFVAAHAQDYPDDWSIVVVCDRSQLELYEKLWRVSNTNLGAFTDLKAKRTIILFDLQTAAVTRQELVLRLIAHELRHVRCMCDLGEGNGRRP